MIQISYFISYSILPFTENSEQIFNIWGFLVNYELIMLHVNIIDRKHNQRIYHRYGTCIEEYIRSYNQD